MNRYRVTVDGETLDVEVSDVGTDHFDVRVGTVCSRIRVEPLPTRCAPPRAPAPAPAGAAPVPPGSVTEERPAPPGEICVRALIPGTVLRVLKQAGDPVDLGETLVLLEAMKMENHIRAPVGGTVKHIHVAPGDRVTGGQALAVLAN